MLKEYVAPVRPEKEELKAKLSAERDKLFANQMKIKDKKLPVMVVFGGWSAAGKGLILGKVIKNIDPRFL